MQGLSIKNRYIVGVALMFVFFTCAVTFWVNYQMKRQALQDAREKARIILDYNLATHSYFSHQLKPAVFKITDAHVPDAYFEPAWMSSTYAVREIETYFKMLASANYYYKECAVNARSPLNEADDFERGILEAIGHTPGKKEWEGIRQLEDGPYYAMIRRGETMEEGCLRCHSSPEEAPEDLVAMYGGSRSFNRKVGELVSVVSIRIPLAAAYSHVDKVTLNILTGFLLMVLTLFLGIHFLNRNLILRPLIYFQKRSELISGDMGSEATSLPDIPLKGEWQTLKTAFDHMAERIRGHKEMLAEKIKVAVADGEKKTMRLSEEISAHKKTAERLLLQSHIVHNINVGLHIYRLEDPDDDHSLRMIAANPATEEMTGKRIDDVIGRTIDESFPELRPRGVPGFYADVVRTGNALELGDFYYEDRDIPPNWYHVKAFPLPDRCVGVSFDQITARKRIEDELARKKKELQALFDHMLSAFAYHRILTDDEGEPIDYVFLEVNPAFERMMGHRRSEIVGRQVTSVYPGIRHAAFNWIETYGRVAISGEPITFEQYFEAQDHWYAVSAYSPAPMHFAATFQDITQRKKAEKNMQSLEAQLRHTQKIEAIGVLAGGIAHDFNNILFPILGFAEMILEDLPPDSPISDSVLEIIDGAKRARELVRQILTFSRQEDGRLQPMRIQHIIKEVVRLLRSTLPSSIRIVQNVDAGCCPVYSDPTQIHQLIMNLVTNAYHAMEENGGVLTIHLKQVDKDETDSLPDRLARGRCAYFSVEDTGHGMDEETLEKVFDPYFTTKEKEKGTGLGLSVVHGVVTSAGGHIHVQNKKGEGTKIDVWFPECVSEEDSGAAEEGSALVHGHEHILLVDDEFPVAKIAKQMMERLGYRVTVRTSSIEALELFQKKPGDFDVVFTDMTMPNMTGDKLTGRIKAIRPEIPVILCTGFSNRLSTDQALLLGVSSLVYKPVLLTDISKSLAKALGRIA